ncbi:hypothetical protein HK405_011908, partial [Cladochytrium tenue]
MPDTADAAATTSDAALAAAVAASAPSPPPSPVLDSVAHEDSYDEPASESDGPTALGAAESAATTAATITPSTSTAADADDPASDADTDVDANALTSALSRSTAARNTRQLSNGKPSVSFYEEPGTEEGADSDADDALEHDVFLLYHPRDAHFVQSLRDGLIENGISVWAGDLFDEDDDDDGMDEDTRLAFLDARGIDESAIVCPVLTASFE